MAAVAVALVLRALLGAVSVSVTDWHLLQKDKAASSCLYDYLLLRLHIC